MDAVPPVISAVTLPTVTFPAVYVFPAAMLALIFVSTGVVPSAPVKEIVVSSFFALACWRPSPCRRYVSLNFVVVETRSISVVN